MVRPTLEKVAARAGVSRATVSRVVNGAATVSPRTAEVVRRAVDELGYVPNLAARSLVTHRTDSIALVVSEPPTRVFSDDPFFSAVIRGVSQVLDEADKQMVLMLTASQSSHDRVERYASARHVDGVLVFSMHGADPLPSVLARHGVPVVSGGKPLDDAGPLAYVDIDNAVGAAAAVEHLIAAGRRRIATIAGPQDMIAGIDRLAGYRTALSHGAQPELVAVGDFTRESGERAMHELLAKEPELDAVFAASDMMAFGAMRALVQAGRRIPDDVAVVGFDDIDAARYAEPPLATVRQPALEMGREMARLLLSVTDGGTVPEPVILHTELVIRESAGG